MEDKQWKWEEPKEKQESSTEKQELSTWEIINDNNDDEPIRGTRLFSKIYEVVILLFVSLQNLRR